MTKTGFLRAAPSAPSPAALLTAINRELVGMTPPDRFITAIAALFDPAAKSVDIASAGHPYPLLITGSGVEVIEQKNSLVLLVEPEVEYEHYVSLTLNPGDRLLIYTDGATEASDHSGGLLGVSGLSRLAGESARSHDDAFLRTLFRRMNEFAGNRLQDDVALLTITRAP